MIDFTGVKAITIPEGNVSKITRKTDNTVLWEKVTSRLPSEYQEVEYIHTPVTAYINTEWVPADATTFNIKFSATTSGYPFGSGSAPRLAAYYNPTGRSQFYNPNNGVEGIYNFQAIGSGIVDVETYTTILSTDTYVCVNGEKQSNGYKVKNLNFDASLPMLLGAWQYNATTIRQAAINLYYAKANVGGVDIFEMIPCYRKSDGVIGMYDLVNNKLFTNAGTGSFTKGADV